MATEDVQQSRRLMRMYSFEASRRLPPGSEAYALGQALSQNAGDRQSLTAPWRKFFEHWEPTGNEVDPITNVISVEASTLVKKWAMFQQNSSENDRLDLVASEPTMESVLETSNQVMAQCQRKRKDGVWGKIKSSFHRFCGTLNAHSWIIQLLPNGNEYVSVFAGALNAVIKASVNHKKVAEGLSEALCAISEDVAECQAELKMFPTKDMLEHVADLYAHIFLFLSSVMEEWVNRKGITKVLNSFNENLFEKFEDHIKKINAKTTAIRTLVGQSSRAELRVTRLAIEKLGRDVRVGLEGEARHHAEIEYLARRIEWADEQARRERQVLSESQQQMNELFLGIKKFLEENALDRIQSNRLENSHHSLTEAPILLIPQNSFPKGSSPRRILPAMASLTRDDVLKNSSHLETFFHRDRTGLDCDPDLPMAAPAEMRAGLGEWALAKPPKKLWIHGPPIVTDDLDNPISAFAAQIASLIRTQTRYPLIAYFCELRRGEKLRASNGSMEMQGFLSLAYSLLRQMAELFLPIIETDIDLSEERFRDLDGTPSSWNDFVHVFRDFEKLIPDHVYCVVDGIHWIDDRNTEQYLTELVRMLRESGKFKVLFTTSGRAATLLEEIEVEETIFLEKSDTVREREALELI